MAEEDLIFGKNRHFFGGIEPSNMLKFTAALDSASGKVRIEAELPKDTVINNQTLCTVSGAVIRRSLTNYPKDEFDGDLVATINGSVSITDTNTSPTGTYYYAVFPFTTQGVYNRNTTNRVVVNEPSNMKAFTAKSVYNAAAGTAKVEITATLPSGVAGAIIRKSTTGYPVSETDGTVFQTITSSGTLTDTNVTIGITYYYSAFPYTSTGAYNRNPANRTNVTPSRYAYLFGYDLNTIDSNPATRVTYPSDVDNTAYAAAKMNLSSGVFSYGGWPSSGKFMPKPCMLTYAGVVDHYLNPNDYTKKVDGSASQVASTAFGGNAMMEWPKIWVKRWTEGNVTKFRCCDIQLDSSYECFCNYDRNNNQIDNFYTPIYFGSSVSSKMRSISGQANFVSNSADTEIAQAKANGADWYTEVLADRLLIQDLLTMIGKSTAHQETFGYGRCSGSNSTAIGQGTMNAKGLFWGSSDQTSGVKVFGMENWWGNLLRRTAGWILENGNQKVKITRGTKDGSTASDYNTTGSGYMTVSGATPTGTNGGYISGCKNMPYGRIPFQANGASSTYESDGLYFNNSGVFYALVGGNWPYALLVGGFYAFLSAAASSSGPGSGAALSCKPLA